MSVTQPMYKSIFFSGAICAAAAVVMLATCCTVRAQDSRPAFDLDFSSTPSGAAHTAQHPIVRGRQLPLARLVRNPDNSGVGPAYALADQSGKIQRYVEAVPGIDLEPYVGYAVKVKHDTGRTLLASQLSLPGQEKDEPAEEDAYTAGPTPVVNSMFENFMGGGGSNYGVEQAQYMPVQSAPMGSGPVMIQGGMPMTQPQGMVAYDPAMGGVPMNAYPPGAAPIYLDGMQQCGPQCCPPCPQPQMMLQPVAPCPPPVTVAPPPPSTKCSLWGEALWIHPTGVDMAHAQQQNGIGGAGTVPFGTIGVVDPDYDLGFRVGGEVRFDPKGSIFVQYSWFNTDAASSLAAPTLPGGGGAVGSLVQHPGTALTASAGPVNATYDIDFQLAEAAFRYFVTCSKTGELTVFAGGRWGKLDQDFSQTGIFGGGLGGTVNTNTTIDFDGAGPLAGVTGEHLIGNSRFTVYGRAMASAITGTFDSTYTMNNSTTSTLLAQSNWSDDRIVPMLDYELGIAWLGPQGHLRLAVGYMATYWFNAVTTPVLVDAVQADNYVNVSDTIAFDGAVGHVEWRW